MNNIVMIYCDELRCDALSCYGNPYGIKTPNIDSLLENGVLFENCYCTSPVCVPSRYSMLTSLAPTKTGVYHNEAAFPIFHLDQDYLTFPQVLKAAGYVTASFGKTHLPQTQSPIFDIENGQGGEMNLGIQVKKEATNVMKLPGTFQSVLAAEYPDSKKYQPEYVTDNGIEWMLKQEAPFFIRFSYLQPHTPIVVPKKYVDRLEHIAFDDTIDYYSTSQFEKRFGEVCDISTMPKEDVARMRKYYYALVLWLDEQVGRIIEALKDKKMYEDTIIMFTADHGASRGENGALAKQTFQPTSHHIPLIIKAKGLNGVRKDICSNLDIGPTLLGLNHITIPETFDGYNLFEKQHEEGYSIVGYGMHDSYAFPNKFQGKWSEQEGWPQRCCIRTKRYRLDLNTRINNHWCEVEEEDLYFTDCEIDPKEKSNLVHDEQYTEVIHDLYTKLKAYSRTQKMILENAVCMDKETFMNYLKQNKG